MSSAITPAAYLEKAKRALASARLLLEAEDTEGACNRAYYSMFDAAHAALLAVGEEIAGDSIKTHAGLIGIFSKQLVQTQRLDASLGRAFNKVQRLRQLGDYTDQVITLEETGWAIEQAAAFVQAVAGFIAKL